MISVDDSQVILDDEQRLPTPRVIATLNEILGFEPAAYPPNARCRAFHYVWKTDHWRFQLYPSFSKRLYVNLRFSRALGIEEREQLNEICFEIIEELDDLQPRIHMGKGRYFERRNMHTFVTTTAINRVLTVISRFQFTIPQKQLLIQEITNSINDSLNSRLKKEQA